MTWPSKPTDQFLDTWNDQREFNLTLRPAPTTDDARSALTSDMVLHMISEIDELLRCVKWKAHRRHDGRYNRAHIREELTDIYKMWMTLAQIWEESPDALMAYYWDKSAVVRQRQAEEWIRESQRPSVIIDLDNVIADYATGMANWLCIRGFITDERRAHLIENRPWIDGTSVGWPPDQWAGITHSFRTTGGFRECPLMPGAKAFVDWIRSNKWNVVYLTSRPIDQFPNILTDTVWYMHYHSIEADFVWWGMNKEKKLRQMDVLQHVHFAVDDDERYVQQFAGAGVRTFHMDPRHDSRTSIFVPGDPIKVASLLDVIHHIHTVEEPTDA